MNKEFFQRSRVIKLFITGLCALFLGTAMRYYNVHLGPESTAPRQTASVIQASQVETATVKEDAATQAPTEDISSEPGRNILNTQSAPENSEIRSQNNAGNDPVSVSQEVGLPNLTIINLIVNPLPMDKNKPVRITATVRNTGTSQAKNVSAELSNFTNSYALGAHSGYNFAPSQQYEFWEEDSYPYFAVCTSGGVNMLRFTIDPLNEIQESNEGDNTFEIAAALVGC